MYRRILVATGGSPWSDAAVDYAATIAARMNAELHILTVLSNFGSFTAPDVMGGSEIVVDIIEQQGQTLLEQAADRAMRMDVPHTTHSMWGNVPETILRKAYEVRCDLIVLGSRTSSGWKRLMLGNVPNAVTAKAQQPVLVVKQPAAAFPDTHLWRRVLVATGGSPWSDAAVDHALRLALKQQCELCLLHVDRGPSQPGEDPTACEGKGILALAEARAAAMGITYNATLAYGHVVNAILNTAINEQCDAIILGSRGLTGWKRLMLGSISNAVTVKSPLPVMIVKHFLGT